MEICHPYPWPRHLEVVSVDEHKPPPPNTIAQGVGVFGGPGY